MARDIHLTAKDGNEGIQSFLLTSFVDAAHIVVKLLDAKHIAVVGNGHASHSVGNSLIYQAFDTRLSIEYRVISMYM